MAAKKKATKKAEPKKIAAPATEMVKVMRFNVKTGERYPLEVKASEVLQDIDGDKGMKDIVL